MAGGTRDALLIILQRRKDGVGTWQEKVLKFRFRFLFFFFCLLLLVLALLLFCRPQQQQPSGVPPAGKAWLQQALRSPSAAPPRRL